MRQAAEFAFGLFGAPDRAIALYREYLEHDPGAVPAHRALARLLLASGDAAGAAEIVQRERDLVDDSGKIEREPSNPRYIVTVRGLGYKFEP